MPNTSESKNATDNKFKIFKHNAKILNFIIAAYFCCSVGNIVSKSHDKFINNQLPIIINELFLLLFNKLIYVILLYYNI